MKYISIEQIESLLQSAPSFVRSKFLSNKIISIEIISSDGLVIAELNKFTIKNYFIVFHLEQKMLLNYITSNLIVHTTYGAYDVRFNMPLKLRDIDVIVKEASKKAIVFEL